MFFIILFLLLLTWLGYREGVTGEILHNNIFVYEGQLLNIRDLVIFTLTLSLALSIKKTFREIAVSLVIFWSLMTVGLPEIASASGAFGFAGLSIISQRPKNKISYMKKVDGRYVENFI
jgi:hypothetical protein